MKDKIQAKIVENSLKRGDERESLTEFEKLVLQIPQREVSRDDLKIHIARACRDGVDNELLSILKEAIEFHEQIKDSAGQA